MREKEEQRETVLEYSAHFEVIHGAGVLSNCWTEGRNREKKKRYFKGIYSETVRCRSRSALKISHLWSITACFNPHSLSENSKRCSKPFHHRGTNHMLSFILDFLPPFVLGLHINQIVEL